jgi:hypothetical protein
MLGIKDKDACVPVGTGSCCISWCDIISTHTYKSVDRELSVCEEHFYILEAGKNLW